MLQLCVFAAPVVVKQFVFVRQSEWLSVLSSWNYWINKLKQYQLHH